MPGLPIPRWPQCWRIAKVKTRGNTKAFFPHIQLLYKLFKVLLKVRKKRGAIDFETVETQMIFNDQGKIERILPMKRNDAHRLIEECMLAANVCASDFLQKNKQPTLYRIMKDLHRTSWLRLRDFLEGVRRAVGRGK